MIRLIFVIFIVVFYLATLNAQTNEKLNKGFDIPKVHLKTNFTFLINPIRPSAMLSTGIKHTENFSLELGLGYYINFKTYTKRTQDKYTGPRIHASYKYFFRNGEDDSWFIGMEGRYDWITNSRWETLSRQGGQFSEIRLVDKKINSASLFIQVGKLLFLDQKKHFFLDFYVGTGVIRHEVHWDLPDDATILENGFNFPINHFPLGLTVRPRLWLGVNIGYAIW